MKSGKKPAYFCLFCNLWQGNLYPWWKQAPFCASIQYMQLAFFRLVTESKNYSTSYTKTSQNHNWYFTELILIGNIFVQNSIKRCFSASNSVTQPAWSCTKVSSIILYNYVIPVWRQQGRIIHLPNKHHYITIHYTFQRVLRERQIPGRKAILILMKASLQSARRYFAFLW